MNLVVTVGRESGPAQLARARLLSQRLSVPFVQRRSLARMHDETGATMFYVVRRAREELVDVEGRGTFVQPGLLATKLGEGDRHPFLRALRGGTHEPISRIVDATLGLANDALHAAMGLSCVVSGIEKSPVIHALLEEGLARMSMRTEPWCTGAARIALQHGDAVDVLRAMHDDSADVVMLDPMMSRPKKSAPAFELLRSFAEHAPASTSLLAQARRVARRRVVLKLGKGAPLPVDRPYPLDDRYDGVQVTYWVHEKRAGGSSVG